jgi:glycosyltransferase involved in cell wall biosynthesis
MAKFLFYDDKIINILLKEEKPSGGAAVQSVGWIRGLSEIGHDVYALTNLNENGTIKDECKDIDLIPLFDYSKGIKWLRWVYYRIPYLYKTIKKYNPDYVYQSVPDWKSFVMACICRKLKIKYVIRISNDFFLDERFLKHNTRLHQYFMSLGLKMSHYILCQNDYQLQQIEHKFPGKKVLKISNPIVLKSNNHLLENDRSYIAWIGIFQYQKNLKLLYEIASTMQDENFCIAGREQSKCDSETLYYLQEIKKLPNVHYIGFLSREQVLPFLSKAKFLLNTSHYEGFSNTFLEAMAVGTPILTSTNVNPNSIINVFNLGIVYSDVTDLKLQLQSIKEDQYTELQNNIDRYIRSNHSHIVLAKKMVNMLNEN